MNNCEFCDEFYGGNKNAFARWYGTQLPNRIINRTNCFGVMPSLGQLSEGHLLVVPVQHHTALADLSPTMTYELDQISSQIRTALRAVYGHSIFFEHGIREPGSGGCGIDHAHLHAVPVEGIGVLKKLAQTFSGYRVEHFSDIGNVIGDSSYLLFEDRGGDRWVFSVSSLESQYMRKLIAASIGKPEWDWRSTGREPELLATLERLSGVLQTAEPAVRG